MRYGCAMVEVEQKEKCTMAEVTKSDGCDDRETERRKRLFVVNSRTPVLKPKVHHIFC